MRDAFVNALLEIAKKERNVILVTGDLGFGVLKPFWEQLPDQIINVGIAEQNMTSLAAGMALEGKTIFTYSIGNFPTLRCIEQIRNDCAYHRANVKIVCIGGGFVYGSLGMSHHATEDIAMMRALPDVLVVCPGDLMEAEKVTQAIAAYDGTCYLRLGRGGEKKVHDHIDDFALGKAVKVRDCKAAQNRVALFSTGAILDAATDACDQLEADGFGVEQYSFHTVKPIDAAVIADCAQRFDYIFTVEEHNIVGGFGSAVAEVLSAQGTATKLIRIGINDLYSSIVGSQAYLRDHYGMSAQKIVERVKSLS